MGKAILLNIIFSMFWKKSFILLFEYVRVGQNNFKQTTIMKLPIYINAYNKISRIVKEKLPCCVYTLN